MDAPRRGVAIAPPSGLYPTAPAEEPAYCPFAALQQYEPHRPLLPPTAYFAAAQPEERGDKQQRMFRNAGASAHLLQVALAGAAPHDPAPAPRGLGFFSGADSSARTAAPRFVSASVQQPQPQEGGSAPYR